MRIGVFARASSFSTVVTFALSSGGDSVDNGLDMSAATASFVVTRPKLGADRVCTDRICHACLHAMAMRATETAAAD